MNKLVYMTHPEVQVDPKVLVPEWSLKPEGIRRAEVFARHSVLSNLMRIVSSRETKALEAAEVIAIRKGLAVEARQDLGENDRSSTGFVPPTEFETLADAFFAHPFQSVQGWERAVDAQARVMASLADLLVVPADGDVLIVGHGGVGTLLYCALLEIPIDRSHDQPHQGCYYVINLQTGRPLSGWRPLED